MPRRRWVFLALAGAAILLVAARVLAQVYVDYQWFDAVGGLSVWRARLQATTALRFLSGLAAGLFVFANLYAVRHSVVSLILPRRVANLEIGEQVPGRYLMFAVVTISIVIGAALSLPQDDWTTFSLAFNNVPFGEPDSYFNSDLGFFVYWLPFEQELYYWTLIGVLIVTALVVFLYALTPSLRWDRGRLYVSGYVRRHLTVLAGVVLLVLAWSFRLDMYGLLTSGHGPGGAFSYIDHKVLIPGNLILAIATLGAAVIVVWSGWTGQGRLAGSAILGIMVLALLTRQVAPFVAERLADEENAVARDRPYAATRAAYSRRAFATDETRAFDRGAAFGSLADAAANVPVWDARALARSLESTRRVDLKTTDFGWRASPSGVVADVPEPPARTGDTTHATFGLSRVLATSADDHGGLIRAPADGRDEDVPSLSAIVFPGARGYLVVSDSLGRIVGAPLERGLSRLAYALSFQRLGWASGKLPYRNPVVVTHRDVRDRLRTLLPFFAQGTVVTPIVAGDSLFWSLDLYTASSSYPLSEAVHVAGSERTYFQHAATAIVYAATGEAYVVADSAPGPMAVSWIRRFPELFTSWASVPASVRVALPPSFDGVRAQAIAFALYGTSSNSYYVRHLPALDGSDTVVADSSALFLMPPARALASEFVLLDSTERVRGLVIGVGGAMRATLTFELPSPGPRWPVVIDRLHGSDSAASTRDGASVVRGPIRIILVGDEVAFVQSAYAWRRDGAPALARVTMLIGDSVRAGPTLAALAGANVPAPRGTTPSAGNDLQARAAALYTAMRDALRRGDWVAFGQAFERLGKLLTPPGAPR